MNTTKDRNTEPKTPEAFLGDLATNELTLAELYLAAADSAAEHQDEDGKRTYLKKAFVTYCRAQIQASELAGPEQAPSSVELQIIHNKIAAAYLEDV